MKKTKRLLSIFLAALLLFSCAASGVSSLLAMAANDELAGEDYNLKLMIPDMLSFQSSEQLQWSYAPNLTAYPNLTNVYLARNEREACQVYFYEKGDGRDLRLEVTPYVNDKGEILPHEIFNEHFFTITNVWDFCPSCSSYSFSMQKTGRSLCVQWQWVPVLPHMKTAVIS